MEALAEEGVLLDALREEAQRDLDPFDLIVHIAFDQPPLTRAERAANVKKRHVYAKYGAEARVVIDALLDKYADDGVLDLADTKVLQLRPFDDMGTVVQLVNRFGGKPGFENAVREIQGALYEQGA